MAAAGRAAPPLRVLILGGGYVAYSVVPALADQIRSGKVACTVVSRDNFHAFHGLAAEMITGRIGADGIISPLRRLVAPAELHVAEIESIDLDAGIVTTSRKLDGRRFSLPYDHLVLGLGSEDRLDAYPGLEEHGYKLRTYPDCFRLRNRLIEMFELAEVETDEEERRRLLTFFVAGGGYAGTELIGELADLARRLCSRDYPRIQFEECRFVLVHPGPTIVPELLEASGVGFGAHPRLVRKAQQRVEHLGAEVRTGTRVASASPSEVRLSNGERIPTRTIISAVGTKPNPVVAKLPVQKDERGRIITDGALRVLDRPGVWAAGDCAAVPSPRGGFCPATGLYAIWEGQKLGRNVARVIEGKLARRFNWPGLGQAASVGRRYAVAELYGMEMWGLPAWLVWRAFLFYYVPSNDLRVRLVWDWLTWPFLGRHIVQQSVDRPADVDVRPSIFQPGEEIARERRSTRYIHVIVEGEVELVEVGSGRVLRTLGPGDHLGIRWLESPELEAAVARTVTRTIALRRDQAPRLQQVLQSAAELRAESGHFPTIDFEDSLSALRPPQPPALDSVD